MDNQTVDIENQNDNIDPRITDIRDRMREIPATDELDRNTPEARLARINFIKRAFSDVIEMSGCFDDVTVSQAQEVINYLFQGQESTVNRSAYEMIRNAITGHQAIPSLVGVHNDNGSDLSSLTMQDQFYLLGEGIKQFLQDHEVNDVACKDSKLEIMRTTIDNAVANASTTRQVVPNRDQQHQPDQENLLGQQDQPVVDDHNVDQQVPAENAIMELVDRFANSFTSLSNPQFLTRAALSAACVGISVGWGVEQGFPIEDAPVSRGFEAAGVPVDDTVAHNFDITAMVGTNFAAIVGLIASGVILSDEIMSAISGHNPIGNRISQVAAAALGGFTAYQFNEGVNNFVDGFNVMGAAMTGISVSTVLVNTVENQLNRFCRTPHNEVQNPRLFELVRDRGNEI